MKVCTQCGTRFSEPVAFCPHDGTPTADAPEEKPKDPLVGRVIDGRYRVERPIGEGGMGVVYAITHAVLGKRMALKVLRPDMAKDAEVVQRFVQEAQSATSIGHPNIIDISDFGRLPDGAVYFVMEYLDGESLSRVISSRGPVPVPIGLHIVRQIASSLEAAHHRGIVHRDLKPDNIYLVRQGADPHFVKVLDFGIAKVGGASSKLTRTGMIFGTPHYMSPEQAAGQPVDHRTDIYALGVIMYEMFTGQVPFDGETFMGILSKHMFEQPVPPSRLEGMSGLGALEPAVLRALAKKPSDRFESMTQLLAELDAIAAGQPVEARPRADGTANVRLTPNVSSPTPDRPDSIIHLPRANRTPVLATLALAAIGLITAGSAYWMTGATAPSAAAENQRPLPTPGTPPGQDPVPILPTPVPVHAPTPEPAREEIAIERVEITSTPAGAEVLVGGVIVGNTPIELPRNAAPNGIVELRHRGYRPASLRLDSGSAQIAAELEVEAPVQSQGRRTRTAPRVSSNTPPPPQAAAPPPARTSSASEVVDPWR